VKLGLNLSNQYLPGESMARRIDEVVEQVELMRELGFDLLVVGQHHLATPFQQPSSVPLVARLAANSGTMRIGITVFLLPLHNPVDIAEQVATLDAISHGRMIFGVGLGYRPEESTFDPQTGRPTFHKITVKLNRPGLRVRSRSGFFGVADTEARELRKSGDLATALASPFGRVVR